MKTLYLNLRDILEKKPRIYSFIVFLSLLAMTAVVSYRVYYLTIAEERQKAFYTGHALSRQLELTLNYGLSATQTIALMIEQGLLPAAFETVAEKTFKAYDILNAIELAPNGVVSHVYPYEQNKKAIGFNILGDAIQKAEALEAIKQHRLIFAGPLNLVQGGVGVVGRLPVFITENGRERFWGFSLVVIKIDRLLSLAKSDELKVKGYYFQLRCFAAAAASVDTFGNKYHSFSNPVILNVTVPNGRWELLIAPAPGWNAMEATAPYTASGVIFSCIIGLFVLYVGKQPEKLTRLVMERTEEIKLSEESYRGLFNSVQDAIYIQDANGVFLDVNEGAVSMYGYERNEIIGKTPEFVSAPGKNDMLDFSIIIPAVMNGTSRRFEFWGKRKNGEIFPKDVRLFKGIYFGKPVIIALAQDITERRRAEESLRESEQRYRTIVEGLSIGIVIHVDNSIVFVNKTLLSMMGTNSSSQFIGRSVIEFVHPEDRQKVINAIQSAFIKPNSSTSEKQSIIEERFVKIDGSIITVEASALLITYQGKPALLVMINDITERKQAEESLRASEVYNRSLIDTSPNSTTVTDLKGYLVYANSQALQMYGHKPNKNIIGKNVFEWVPVTNHNLVKIKFGELLMGTVVRNLKLQLLKANGDPFWAEINASLVTDADGNPANFLIITSDITEKVRAENEIRSLNAELEDRVERRTAQLTEAVAELEAFSYSVSHDLRAPLRSIDGYTAIFSERYKNNFDEEGKRLLSNVRNSIDKMDMLIKGLLTLSRIGRSELRFVELSMEKLIHTTYEECSTEETRKKIQFTISSLPTVMVDVALIQQVWTNLISNALKYSERQQHPQIEVGATKEDGRVVFYVKDNGAGFDPKYSNKLFGIFQRLHVDDEFKGVGIGLSIVKRIVQRHGGAVWAEGKTNEGAIFYFSIPTAV
jgi:PAS domain S-box-containing protein